jgi:hypothetical protein
MPSWLGYGQLCFLPHKQKYYWERVFELPPERSTTILYIVGTEVLQHTLARARGQFHIFVCFLLLILILILIYLLTANGLTPGGSSTVHIYTQTRVHIYTQTIVGDKQHRKLADFPRFRANTKMTPQFLLVNTCFTCRSLCINATKLTPSCRSHQITFPNHTIRNYVKIPRPFIQISNSFKLCYLLYSRAKKTWAPNMK